MDWFFYLSKAVAVLVLPPTGLILLSLLALLFLNRWPRTARTTLWLSVLSLFVLALPVVSRGFVTLLDAPPLDPKAGQSAKAIIVLGGGLLRGTPEYGDTLSKPSLTRVRYAAKLARAHHLPILVTGGAVYGGTPEAEVMARVLNDEFGIEAKWVEKAARHTGENARLSAELLKQDKIKTILLVTDDLHMRRSLAHCEAAGLICYSAPVSTQGHSSDSWIEQLPHAGALAQSSYALHELLGNLTLRWR
jgi:uncharacterized SAM-binding protein YcdF (DUF218 family)